MRVPYHIVIEPTEYDQYAAVIDKSKILVLPFHDLGQGSIPARNWVWEHAKNNGATWHWILDDNIRWFARLYRNKKIKLLDGTCFAVTEDFVERFENIGQAGLQYAMFIPATLKTKPFLLNTRIYSCILNRTDLPFRWRGRYNEDTDLSLRILKAGWCTVLMQIFICNKTTTMTMKGGNTDELYQGDGRLQMAQSLFMQHPDVVRVTRKWGRWQHHVDYRGFKQRPILKPGVVIPQGVDDYSMILKRRDSDGNWQPVGTYA